MARLQESEERYRQFFEDDLTGDFIAKVDGALLACNPSFARIFGFSSVEEAL
ncbi:MAG: PAS domain S-box protein [Syntrophotaleaceae bacterium]